jgi:hypothetical protein
MRFIVRVVLPDPRGIEAMVLRILLVGLVAALGLDLPDSAEIAGWRKSGHEWASARMADLSSLLVEAELAFGASPDRAIGGESREVETIPVAPSSRVDLAFEAVVEGMASGFSADLALMEESKPPVEEAVASVEPTPEGPAAGVASPEPAPAAEILAPPISRLERISTAVRLTRQAVDAWASIIQPTADREYEDGPGDSL